MSEVEVPKADKEDEDYVLPTSPREDGSDSDATQPQPELEHPTSSREEPDVADDGEVVLMSHKFFPNRIGTDPAVLEEQCSREDPEEADDGEVAIISYRFSPKLEGHPEVSEACIEESEPKNMKEMLGQYSLAMNFNIDHPCRHQHHEAESEAEDEYAGDWSSPDRAAGPQTPSWQTGSPPPSSPTTSSPTAELHGVGPAAHDEVYEDNRSNEETEEEEDKEDLNLAEAEEEETSRLGCRSRSRKRKATSAVAESESPAVDHGRVAVDLDS